jgi:DNA sulfur modification protein DndD
VLLSTDEEIMGQYLQDLEPHVGKMHLLEYNEDQDCTTITDGYFQ